MNSLINTFIDTYLKLYLKNIEKLDFSIINSTIKINTVVPNCVYFNEIFKLSNFNLTINSGIINNMTIEFPLNIKSNSIQIKIKHSSFFVSQLEEKEKSSRKASLLIEDQSLHEKKENQNLTSSNSSFLDSTQDNIVFNLEIFIDSIDFFLFSSEKILHIKIDSFSFSPSGSISRDDDIFDEIQFELNRGFIKNVKSSSSCKDENGKCKDGKDNKNSKDINDYKNKIDCTDNKFKWFMRKVFFLKDVKILLINKITDIPDEKNILAKTFSLGGYLDYDEGLNFSRIMLFIDNFIFDVNPYTMLNMIKVYKGFDFIKDVKNIKDEGQKSLYFELILANISINYFSDFSNENILGYYFIEYMRLNSQFMIYMKHSVLSLYNNMKNGIENIELTSSFQSIKENERLYNISINIFVSKDKQRYSLLKENFSIELHWKNISNIKLKIRKIIAQININVFSIFDFLEFFNNLIERISVIINSFIKEELKCSDEQICYQINNNQHSLKHFLKISLFLEIFCLRFGENFPIFLSNKSNTNNFVVKFETIFYKFSFIIKEVQSKNSNETIPTSTYLFEFESSFHINHTNNLTQLVNTIISDAHISLDNKFTESIYSAKSINLSLKNLSINLSPYDLNFFSALLNRKKIYSTIQNKTSQNFIIKQFGVNQIFPSQSTFQIISNDFV